MRSPSSHVIPAAAVFMLACVAAPLQAQQSATPEPALTRNHDDPQLEWGPCPPIFPEGCEVTVLWGDPENGRSDIFLRTPPGSVLAEHWHTSPEHMILVAGEMQVTYRDQPTATLRPGTYAFGPAKAPHGARCGSAATCVLFVSFETPIDAHLVDE